MNTTRNEHIASAIDFLNSVAAPAEYVDRRPFVYYRAAGARPHQLHRLQKSKGNTLVLSARTKREFLALVEAYTRGARDHA